MRAALISIAGQPRAEDRAPLTVAGKTLACRQLDFALAAGCERIVAIGDGAGAEAIALRHAAEGAGAAFQVVRNSHGLLGTVRAADELLVLAPGLLPEASEAIETLGKTKALLVLPAGPGVAAGFERIDLERAWAGAVVVSGAQVERLAELPPDTEAASALMRIALQARVSERRLDEQALADGSWTMLADAGDAAASERAWLKRHLPAASPWAISRWLARQALRRLASAALAASQSLPALLVAVPALAAAAVGAAWYGWPALGFALLALGAPLAEFALALAGLRAAPFGARRRWHAGLVARCGLDAALVACGALAIEGSWLHRLFPPLVLLGALHLARSDRPQAAVLLRDRGVLAALFALSAVFGVAEPAIMLAALALIALNVAQSGSRRG